MRTSRGEIATVTVLAYVIIGLLALYVPNPISTAIGIGNRQNKIIQTDRVTLINDKDGVPIAYRTVTDNSEIQQKSTFWEWLTSLPIFVLFLMIMGIIFPPIAMVLGTLWRNLWKETKKIVVSVDQALDNIHDPVVKQTILDKMDGVQNESTKDLVDKIQGKT